MASIKEDTIIHLDFTVEPPCESMIHGQDHTHSGAAAYWQDGACSHSTGFRCAPSVARIKAREPGHPAHCPVCGWRGLVADLRFTAI